MMIDDSSSMLQVAQRVDRSPGLVIMIILRGFSIGGDGLRDALVTRPPENVYRGAMP